MLATVPLQDGHASTLRTALGYSSGLFYDFGAYVQLEDVRVFGDDAYNNGPTVSLAVAGPQGR